ncbi:MAG: hypothetical protein HGA97_12105 [Chlorobiaceae bacterium]|nr:hypothetical protein [Chlorobiaceae bacterium]
MGTTHDKNGGTHFIIKPEKLYGNIGISNLAIVVYFSCTEKPLHWKHDDPSELTSNASPFYISSHVPHPALPFFREAKCESIERPALLLMWWNVENLFDTRNDPNTDNDEFTPEGQLQW